jgi:hypothetical protein
MGIAGILGRCMATAVPLLSLLSPRASAQPLPTLYVNARTGSDSNDGLSPTVGTPPSGPVKTIGRALVLASGSLSAPRSILIAGVANVFGNPIPYDDTVNGECFPLPMLSQVSLVWDQSNSDTLPTDPPSKALAILRKNPPLGPILRFSSAIPTCPPSLPYTPGAGAVQLDGLFFEGGHPAVEIFDNPAGPVRPLLTNVSFQRGITAVSVSAPTSAITPTFSRCSFTRVPEGASPPPGAGGTSDFLLNLETPGPAATGTIAATISDCTFLAAGTAPSPSSPGVDLKTRYAVRVSLPDGAGSITASVTGSLFVGSANNYGLLTGVETSLRHAQAGANPGRFDVSVSGSTFLDCREPCVNMLTVPYPGASAGAKSSLQVSDSSFSQPGIPGAGLAGGQVTLDFGAGHRANVQIIGNQFTKSPRDAINLGSSTPNVLAATEGDLELVITQNAIKEQGGDGIELHPSATIVKGLISRNDILDGIGNGIDNHPEGASSLTTSCNVDLVNNMIGYNGGHGIINRATQAGGAGAVSAMARPSFNTVVGNTGFGLQNAAYIAAALPIFQVWDSIFYNNVAGDINTGPGGTLPESNIFWTRFAVPPPTINSNTALLPQLTNPGGRDFSLQPGSPMIDMADSTAPAVTSVDFFGNPRLKDHCGVGSEGRACGGTSLNFADKGAHERP